MIQALLDGILNALAGLVTFILTPLNLLFSGLFPNMSQGISVFTTFVNNYINNGINYFVYMLPPIFKTILITWFQFVVLYYAVYYTYIGFLKIFNIIQKVKFW